jgi:hypothetical protein
MVNDRKQVIENVTREGTGLMKDLQILLRDYTNESTSIESEALKTRADAVIQFGNILRDATMLLCKETVLSHIRTLQVDVTSFTDPDSELLFQIKDKGNELLLTNLNHKIDSLQQFLEA